MLMRYLPYRVLSLSALLDSRPVKLGFRGTNLDQKLLQSSQMGDLDESGGSDHPWAIGLANGTPYVCTIFLYL